jgi:hypothetical protein
MDNVCKPVDPKWGCIGSVPPVMGGGMTTVKAQLLDLISGNPIPGLFVRLCNKLDTTCGSPIDTPTPDASGWVSVTVKSDFDGYLDIEGPNQMYLPALIFLDLVAIGQNTDILLIPVAAQQSLAQNAGIMIDPMKGLVLVRTVDCTNKRTDGVSVSMSPQGGAAGFYVINNALVTSATQTDGAGNAGFANVPVGTVTLTGTVAASGKELGKVTTLSRAGAMTYQVLRPTTVP